MSRTLIALGIVLVATLALAGWGLTRAPVLEGLPAAAGGALLVYGVATAGPDIWQRSLAIAGTAMLLTLVTEVLAGSGAVTPYLMAGILSTWLLAPLSVRWVREVAAKLGLLWSDYRTGRARGLTYSLIVMAL